MGKIQKSTAKIKHLEMAMGRKVFPVLLLFLALAGGATTVNAQTQDNEGKFLAWLPWQFLPNLTWHSGSPVSAFGFEWEATPLLYSFGMNKQISPWYFFIVEPTARFTGSIELNVAMQVFTKKAGSSYFGVSGQLMGFIPLIERGEHLTLNLGTAVYRVANETPVYGIVGVSTLFSILHLNVKYSPNYKSWVTSIEFRVF